MTKRNIFITTVVVLIVAVVAISQIIYYLPNTFQKKQSMETLIIKQDETGDAICNELHDRGLIRWTYAFKIAMRLTGTSDKLQSGYYQIPTPVSMHDLIHLLQKGKVQSIRVTIPEGYTIGDIAKELQRNGLVDGQDFLNTAKTYVPYQYMYGPAKVTYRVEGFLFPSTYDIPVGSSSKDIIHMMAEEMNRQLTADMRKRIEAQHMTIFQFITLASLVEKEALFDEDRPKIAAVFKKRLALHMPLQSDATIQYILGYPKVHVTYADTRLASPYNTYAITGLPPGPIANPGLSSMEAVLNAGDTDYLYFVADKEGHNHFSKNYEEHEEVVASIYGTE